MLSTNTSARCPMAGVTLVELLVVVTMIGILSLVAVPSYRQYIQRAHRTEAKTALLQLATNEERFYLANRTYGGTASLTALGFPTGLTENSAYQITVPVADASTYTLTATPVAGGRIDMTTDAKCTSLSLTAQGVKTATGSDATSCW